MPPELGLLLLSQAGLAAVFLTLGSISGCWQRKPGVPRATEVTAVGWRCPSRDSIVGKSYLLGNKI